MTTFLTHTNCERVIDRGEHLQSQVASAATLLPLLMLTWKRRERERDALVADLLKSLHLTYVVLQDVAVPASASL